MPDPSDATPLLSLADNPSVATLDGYLAAGGFRGLQVVRAANPLLTVTELRTSCLRERAGRGRMVYEKWWSYLTRSGDGVLLVDGRRLDTRSTRAERLIVGNPLGLIEALAIAAAAGGSGRAVVALGSQPLGHAARLQNALEAAGRAGLLEGLDLTLETPAGLLPPVLGSAARVLEMDLETWYHVMLVFCRGAAAVASLGLRGQSGTRLVAVGGAVASPGLVEVPMGAPIGWALDAAGGLLPQKRVVGEVKGLALDRGVSGFLAPDQADIPLAPEELMWSGVGPGLATVWALDTTHCVVDMTRRALVRILKLGLDAEPAMRKLVLHAVRFVTELSLRRGGWDHLDQLAVLADQLTAMGAASAWPLQSALRHFPQEWALHARGLSCVAFDCLKPLVAPCHAACPAGIDIPSFLALVGQNRHAEAVAVIRRDNPLPYICGLVCPAPCERRCLRGELDQPISIRAMKAVAARHALAEGGYPPPEKAPDSGHGAAVIGAGPAGLSAAWFLALKGHRVTLFEAQEVVGGTAFTGIPAYRLPREVIAAEVAAIAEAGVDIQTGRALGRDFTLDSLRDQGYEAVFLGIGATCGYSLGIPGEGEYPQVLDALTFLRQVALDQAGRPADSVVVVGGGNAAMDAARTLVRLGASRVVISYRRTRGEMPAHEEEIADAMAEGVEIAFLTIPLAVEGQDGRVTGLRCLRAELGPPDASGRRRPMPVADSEFVMPAGAVIAAISQTPDLACLGPLAEDQGVCGRTVVVDPRTGQTRLPWLFAGGDAVSGPATVVEAVATGKRAAGAMDAFLRGEDPLSGLEPASPRARLAPMTMQAVDKARLHRPEMPMRPVAERRKDFAAVELGLSDAMARGEAARCLRCDLCIGCGLCQTACAEMGVNALQLGETPAGRLALVDFYHTADTCVGCGSCANACPTGALTMTDEGDLRRISLAGAVLSELVLERCTRCGRPYAPQAYLDFLAGRLDDLHKEGAALTEKVCSDCLRRPQGRQSFARRLLPGGRGLTKGRE